MKKLIALAALVLSSVGAFAQYSKGDITIQPKVGLSVYKNSNDQTDSKAGFIGGVEAEYHTSSLLGISAGLQYTMAGWKLKDTDEKVSLDYITIPVLANFYVAEGLALKVGVQPGFNVRNKFSTGGKSVDYDDVLKAAGGELKKFDFAIPIGASYEYQNFCLDARVNISATKLADIEDSAHLIGLQITLGYKFAL